MAAAGEFITHARQLCTNGCYSKAFDLYLEAFQKNPDLKALYEPEFRSTLLELNEMLAAADKIEDVFSNFGKAINTFPGNIHLLNELGKYLYKFEFYEEAWSQFQKALKLDPGFVDAEKNLNSLKNLMMERWHFRMLNDKVRNESYRAALHELIIPIKESILDLGTGTGLLAMYATEKKPMGVTACDSSKVMTTLTNYILEENKLFLSVIVVNKISTSMNYRDIGGKRSLLITEVFDAGLFGEHILQSLSHAWEYLLANKAKVIPHKAEFFVMGAKSDLLNAKYHLHSTAKALLNIPKLNVHMLASEEDTYDCEDVHYYKDIKYVTESESVVSVEFNNINDIRDKLEHSEPLNVELKATENGEIDVIVGWFNLYLTENITVTTDPRSKSRANAWQQAVFFDHVPKSIKENETIDLHFLINAGKLTMLSNSSNDIIRVSAETIRFLNDTDYMKGIRNCIGMACVYLGQMAEMSEINILDLSLFPMFGLLMLKRGVQNLTCLANTEEDKLFIEEVFKANQVESSKVTFLVGEDWTSESFYVDKYHAIFCNMLDVCGDIDFRAKQIGQSLKNDHLLQGGLYMPANVTLMAQIVNSHWLDINNRVYDENLGDYKVALHVNKYQVSQNFCLDYTHLEYTPLSDPVSLGNCNNLASDVIYVPILQDGDANAIICWYNIELMENLEQISTKRPYSHIEGTAFMANPKVPMVQEDIANILLCVDSDGPFKLVIDLEGN